MSIKKNALIIGAGRSQVPIIDLCHQYGYKVICVSPKGNYPGLDIADDVLYEDVKNIESILNFANEKKIDAVFTDQLDAGVLTAAYVSEKIGVKTITYETALKFTNKFIMRQCAKKAGIAVPQCVCASTIEDAMEKSKNMTFPLIMKPVDSAASRGISKIENANDIEKFFSYAQQYSRTNSVILETFITGKEYVVEAFTKNYKTQNLIVGERTYFDIPGEFIPSTTIFRDANSADSSIENRLKQTNKHLVESFGLPFGITHAEFLYDDVSDTIYLVEIAARGGGVFISSDLIPMACGVNAIDLLTKENLGIPYEDKIVLNQGSSAYLCYLCPDGKIISIKGMPQIKDIPGVEKVFFDNISVGMQLPPIKDKSSRKGPFLIKGCTKDECLNVMKKIKSTFDISIVDSAGNSKGVIW